MARKRDVMFRCFSVVARYWASEETFTGARRRLGSTRKASPRNGLNWEMVDWEGLMVNIAARKNTIRCITLAQ